MQFLFLRGELLKLRLKRVFAQVGLNYENYYVYRSYPSKPYRLIQVVNINLSKPGFIPTPPNSPLPTPHSPLPKAKTELHKSKDDYGRRKDLPGTFRSGWGFP